VTKYLLASALGSSPIEREDERASREACKLQEGFGLGFLPYGERRKIIEGELGIL
jgi:hypothetical protein